MTVDAQIDEYEALVHFVIALFASDEEQSAEALAERRARNKPRWLDSVRREALRHAGLARPRIWSMCE